MKSFKCWCSVRIRKGRREKGGRLKALLIVRRQREEKSALPVADSGLHLGRVGSFLFFFFWKLYIRSVEMGGVGHGCPHTD